jgi:hypothetical protein
MPKIVMSYRRADSLTMAGRIRDRLAQHYGPAAIFRDLEGIPIGQRFPDVIRNEIAGSDVLLALIGPQWISGDAAQPRIQDPNDPVRIELEAAMELKVPIVPVLIGSTSMPGAETLPASLHDILLFNAAVVDPGKDFDHHMARLIAAIDKPQSFVPALLLIDGADTILRSASGILAHGNADLSNLTWVMFGLAELLAAAAILQRLPLMRWIGAAVCASAALLSAYVLFGSEQWFSDVAAATWAIHQLAFAALFATACAFCLVGWQRNLGEGRSLGAAPAKRLSIAAFLMFAVLAGALSLLDAAALVATPADVFKLTALAVVLTIVLAYFARALIRPRPAA